MLQAACKGRYESPIHRAPQMRVTRWINPIFPVSTGETHGVGSSAAAGAGWAAAGWRVSAEVVAGKQQALLDHLLHAEALPLQPGAPLRFHVGHHHRGGSRGRRSPAQRVLRAHLLGRPRGRRRRRLARGAMRAHTRLCNTELVLSNPTLLGSPTILAMRYH